MASEKQRPRLAILAGVVAIVFGVATLYSGGSVVLVDGPARVAAGDYIPFVVWFNFLAGFFYIIAGVGLLLWRKCAIQLSALIALSTILVFAFLGIYIAQGNLYEMRTVAAMVLRSTIWIVIALYSWKAWKAVRID